MAQTTRYWTWAQIKAKVESELDLEEETIVDSDELREYANDAIREARAEIEGIYEDYFLTRYPLPLVNGTDAYDLPTTIYAHKIRSVIYYKGTDVYPVKRIPTLQKFLEYRFARTQPGNEGMEYGYFLTHDTSGDPQILLSPAAFETGNYVEIWHNRNANRLEDDSDVCDIPEFIQFVFDYIGERVFRKTEAGSPKHQAASQAVEKARALMVETLTAMVQDNDNEIEADCSFYGGMV